MASPHLIDQLRGSGLSPIQPAPPSHHRHAESDAKTLSSSPALDAPLRIHTEAERAQKMMERTRRAYLDKAGVSVSSHNATSLSRLKSDTSLLMGLARDMQEGYSHSAQVRANQQPSLRNVHDIVKGVLIQDQRRGRKVYKRVFIASEGVTWLLTYCKHKRVFVETGPKTKPEEKLAESFVGGMGFDATKGRAVNRNDAVGILQELLRHRIIHGATGEQVAADNKTLFCFERDGQQEIIQTKPTAVGNLDLALSPLDLSVKLLDLSLELFRHVREGRVCIHNLSKVANQPKWKEFSQTLVKLEKVDLKPLNHEQRLCFFINVYNVLNMNACAFRLPSLDRSRSSSRQISKSYSNDFSASHRASSDANPLSPTAGNQPPITEIPTSPAPETPSNTHPKIAKKSKLKMQSVCDSHRLVVSVLEIKDFWELEEQPPILEFSVGNTQKRILDEKAESTVEFEEVERSDVLSLKAYYTPTGEPEASYQLAISELESPPDAPSESPERQEWVRLTRQNVTIGRVHLRIQYVKSEDLEHEHSDNDAAEVEHTEGLAAACASPTSSSTFGSPAPSHASSRPSPPAMSTPSSRASASGRRTSKGAFAYLASFFASDPSSHPPDEDKGTDMHDHSARSLNPANRGLLLRPIFYQNSVYNIGGLWYSLFDLEHRVLRSTHSPLDIPELKNKRRIFQRRDPRREFVIDHWDPRVNFALGHGIISSSNVRVIRSVASLDETLTQCVRDVLKSQLKLHLIAGEKVDKNAPTISRLLVWPPWVFQAFQHDFGPPEQVMEWILPHLPLSLRTELSSQWQAAVSAYELEAQEAKEQNRKFSKRPPMPYCSTQELDNSFYYDVALTDSKPRSCGCYKGRDLNSSSIAVDLHVLGFSEQHLQGVATVIDNPVQRWATREKEWFSNCTTWKDLISIVLAPPESPHPFQLMISQFVGILSAQYPISGFQMECDIMNCSGLNFVIKFLASLYQLVCSSCPLCNSSTVEVPESYNKEDFITYQVDPALSPQFNILRLLERRVFGEVFAIVFQWYQKRYREADIALAAKRQQLDGVSLRQLGVEPPYLLSELHPEINPSNCGCHTSPPAQEPPPIPDVVQPPPVQPPPEPSPMGSPLSNPPSPLVDSALPILATSAPVSADLPLSSSVPSESSGSPPADTMDSATLASPQSASLLLPTEPSHPTEQPVHPAEPVSRSAEVIVFQPSSKIPDTPSEFECVHGQPYVDPIRSFNRIVRLKSPSAILALLGSVIEKIDRSVVGYWHHPTNVASRPKSISLTAEDIVVIFTYVLSKANPNALSSLTALGYFLSDYFERCIGVMPHGSNDSGVAFNDFYEGVFLGPTGFSLASTQAATGYMNSVDALC